MSPTTKQRRAVYEAELEAAALDGLEHPLCNICGQPVIPPQPWDLSHWPVAEAFEGSKVGIAHSRCNRLHGAQVVWPAVAKSNRVRDKHRGVFRSRNPMPCGKDSKFKKKVTGEVVRR